MYVGTWMEEGKLYIDSISLTDINGNNTYKDQNNYDFSDKYVVIPEMDREAPKVKNIILENNTQNGEGRVKISVDLEDKNKIQSAELRYTNYNSEQFKY